VRKPLMAIAIAACLIMSAVGGLLPILQGWFFFVIALYLLATEFESGCRWVKAARRRWPWLDRWIVRARDHKWAPSHLKEFEDLTDPSK
jgi:predicted membrane metal-binding protein